ncbi:MAG: C2H2-type zinc finger protein [Desulfosalsimonadaceae bacterium]
MTGLRIQCPNCKRTDFTTTEKYRADEKPNGSMVKCTLPYKIDWLTLSTTGVSEMTCPECLAQLAPSGSLVVLPAPPEIPAYEIEGVKVQIPDGSLDVAPAIPAVSAPAEDKAMADQTNTGSGFECPICHASFETKRKLHGHMGGAHRGKK